MHQKCGTFVLQCPCRERRTAVKCLQEQPDTDRPALPRDTDEEGTSGQSGSTEVIPMFFERLTAWTLVVVYYTITCGAIVLGLKGAL